MKRFAAYILTAMDVPERVEDANDLARQLEKLDVFEQVECLPAIYWTDPNAAARFLVDHPDHTFTPAFLDRALKGQLCCTLTHISAWRRLLDSDLDGAIVFEDDMYVSDEDGMASLMELLSQPNDVEWLRIHLHKRFRAGVIDETADLALVDDPSRWGFATYFMTRSGAEKMVGAFTDIDEPVDMIIPRMGQAGSMVCKTVNHPLVEHHPFEGDETELLERHPREQQAFKLQKQASTIYASPDLTPDDALYHYASELPRLKALQRDGVTVLENVFDADTIARTREQILAHRDLYPNTRPTPSSGHLASFHRYPELEALHTLLAGNDRVRHFLRLAMGGRRARTIGLSDITINRSQHWHKDLLRGKYEAYLDGVDIWSPESGAVYKALMYLQDGASLHVVRGSHAVPLSLDNDEQAEPGDGDEVMTVPVKAGDVMIMDIRTSHRGSEESAFASGAFDDEPKILVSTALGTDGGKLTDAMEIGNARHLIDWQAKHGASAA